MTTYYGFLWTVSLLNLLRVFVQIAQTEVSHPALWNWMWIITRFGERRGNSIRIHMIDLLYSMFEPKHSSKGLGLLYAYHGGLRGFGG